MGVINFHEEKEISRRVKSSLRRRGLKVDLETEEWEIHGPHPQMNYQVYVGYVDFIPAPDAKCTCPPGSQRTYCPVHGGCCVAVYPRAVYEIEEISKWWDTKPEDRIFIRTTNNEQRCCM
ncbi:MAG: hypothetical protein GH144_01250 [Clostridia bacterium]|jgi:hypothetical protein|nr:hypothetical protein [Clostridia bacterium]